MSAVKLITVFAENKLGQMARITGLLAEARVNIRWMNIATSEAFGVVRFLVDKCDLAYQCLKASGRTVSLIEVLCIEVDDRPGGVHAIVECLARRQVNVENASGFVFHDKAVLIIEVEDVQAARQALEQEGLRMVSQEELLTL